MRVQTPLIVFLRRWQLLVTLEVILWSIAVGLLVFLFTHKLNWAFLGMGFSMGVLLLFRKPWNLDLSLVSRYLDGRLPDLEFSSELLLGSHQTSSGLQRLQQEKIQKVLQSQSLSLLPKTTLKYSGLALLFVVIVGSMVFWSGWDPVPQQNENPNADAISFQPLDTLLQPLDSLRLVRQEIVISYPEYTGVPPFTSPLTNLEVLEGSQVKWELEFSGPIDSLHWEFNSSAVPLIQKQGVFGHRHQVNESGIYGFKFWDTLGNRYTSELYSIKMLSDQPPQIELPNQPQFASFDFDQELILPLEARVMDDFGIKDARIVATVSRGSGESVKFREASLDFENSANTYGKHYNFLKSIALKTLGMTPGDELYYYVEVQDNKTPIPNKSRSETFFAVIRDTAEISYSLAGNLGADLMPDYFRSQRQLIIDTEQLIRDESKLTKQEFNSTSNALGFDQKALRLKYGEFMGEEADSGLDTGTLESEEAGNTLEDYTHDHDGDNEHNLVGHEGETHVHDHGEEQEEEQSQDPLEAYLHNHDDPEESTLFTQSLKDMLREAMAQMWDAELQLRLYQPEASLPYQYKALKLLQDIKNSARIYVHRIGFDPPPIREDVRLSGNLEETRNSNVRKSPAAEEAFPAIRRAVWLFQAKTQQTLSFDNAELEIIEKAGEEMAGLAIARPGQYLQELATLRRLLQKGWAYQRETEAVLRGFYQAVPNTLPKASLKKRWVSDLDRLFTEQWQGNEP